MIGAVTQRWVAMEGPVYTIRYRDRVWRPGVVARELIAAASFQAVEAERICREKPELGTWEYL